MTKKELLAKLGRVFEATRPKCVKNSKNPNGIKLTPSTRTIILALLEKGSQNQRTLSKKANITAQAVSDIVKKLSENGILSKESGESYNENLITLTQKGVDLAKEIDKTATISSEKMFENFSEKELNDLYLLLDKINLEKN